MRVLFWLTVWAGAMAGGWLLVYRPWLGIAVASIGFVALMCGTKAGLILIQVFGVN